MCVNKQNDFIKRSKHIHGDKYDYSKVKYINMRTKVCIICPEHGEFWQLPSNHIKKIRPSGCSLCGINNQQTPKHTFIQKAKFIHDDKYDYSKVKYVNAKTKVCIICPEHGDFWQTPNSHISQKSGCISCVKVNDLVSFKYKANDVHNFKYDYSETEYLIGYKFKIICPEHGEFYQDMCNHLSGKGCPKCNRSKGELEISNILNSLNINFIEQYRFEDCRNKRPLPFDFYLPEMNTCIEYDGEQHFREIGIFGGKNALYKLILNDQIKTEYCKENNIRLIRIRYDEDVESKLDSSFYDNFYS